MIFGIVQFWAKTESEGDGGDVGTHASDERRKEDRAEDKESFGTGLAKACTRVAWRSVAGVLRTGIRDSRTDAPRGVRHFPEIRHVVTFELGA